MNHLTQDEWDLTKFYCKDIWKCFDRGGFDYSKRQKAGERKDVNCLLGAEGNNVGPTP